MRKFVDYKVDRSMFTWLYLIKPLMEYGDVICECVLLSESVKHFFLYYPKYAAQRNVLLTSADSNKLKAKHDHRATMQLNFVFNDVKSVLLFSVKFEVL